MSIATIRSPAAASVRRLIPGLLALKIKQSGEPAHPLYLKGELESRPLTSF